MRGGAPTAESQAPVLGLRANARQFALLVVVNAFVGAVVGTERAVLPLFGEQVFAVASGAALLSFIATFGLAKAFTNLFAGSWADREGRRRVLLIGWLVGLPVPFALIFAPPPHWWIVVAANLLLGVNQGLCWSVTVIAKLDLVGPRQRGLAVGLNEFAGYLAVGAAALITAYLATLYGLRTAPFVFMAACVIAGLALSAGFVRETLPHVKEEARQRADTATAARFKDAFVRASWGDRTLFGCSQAGLVNNLNDGAIWGLAPLLFATQVHDLALVGALVAAYPITWGLAQIFTGAASDRFGRRAFIVGGMLLQGAAIVALATIHDPGVWAASMVALGIGTACVYPTLIGAIGDVAHPEERAAFVGVYRFWRDLGYPAGAILGGVLADAAGSGASLLAVGALTAASGILFAVVGRETAPRKMAGKAAAGAPPGS